MGRQLFVDPNAAQAIDLIQAGNRARADALEKIAAAQARSAEIGGNAQANAAQQSGQAWAGAANQLGQIPQQIQRQQFADLQNKNLQGEIADRAAQQQARDRENASVAAGSAAIKASVDPATGQVDHDKAASLWEQAGFPTAANAYRESIQKTQATAQQLTEGNQKIEAGKRQVAQASVDHLGELAANGIEALDKKSPMDARDTTLGLVANAASHGIISEQDATQFLAQTAGASPDQLKAIFQHFVDQSPATKDKAVKDQSAAAALAKTQAETAKTQAEVSGTLPQTPAQVETARHNTEMERIGRLNAGREAAAQAETARHNKAVENPLGITAQITGQPAGEQSAQVHGADFLKTLPPPLATTVQKYAEGKLAFPTGRAAAMPQVQQLIGLVGQYDPNFDAVDYNARSRTRAAFTSGKEAAQVNALNTVIGHMDKLSDAAEALNNTSVPMLNSALNTLSKAIGRPNVTNFDTIRKAVADEVTKVWRQAGGSVEDIRTAQENLNAANSPDQLRGAIATYGELLQSKLSSLQDQYKQGMGTSDINMLRPDSAQVLEKIAGRATGATPATPVVWERGPDGKPRKVGG